MSHRGPSLQQDTSVHIGRGRIVLEKWQGHLHLSDLAFTYPLKLVAPKPSMECQSIFMLSYGGGLVGGDMLDLSVVLEPDTVLALLTQGSTKIFKKRLGLPATKQILNVEVRENATCLLIPDPVQPFAEAVYIQDQQFLLHKNANVILLDWLVSGRPANGECWEFENFTSSNAIKSVHDATLKGSQDAPRLVLRDCQIMAGLQTKKQMGPYNCLATLLFTGPKTTFASTVISGKFKDMERISGHTTGSGTSSELIWTVSKHRDVTVIKVAAQSSEDVKYFVNEVVELVSWRKLFGRDAFRALE